MTGDWGDLLMRFPDQPVDVIKRLKGVSASAGGYDIGGLLQVEVGQEGLRMGISDLFVPFIFVPWKDIRVSRTAGLWPRAILSLGDPELGRVKVEGHVADRMAMAAEGAWPEPSLPQSSERLALIAFAVEWPASIALVGSFLGVGALVGHLLQQPMENPATMVIAAGVVGTIGPVWRLIDRLRD